MKNFIIFLFLVFAFACKQKSKNIIEKKYEDGSPRVVSVYENNDTTKNKIAETQYYKSGKKMAEGKMKNGKRDGMWVSYYENGNKWSENNYLEGVKDGKTSTWYPDGKPQYIGQFKNDQCVGKWKYWAQNGVDVIDKDYSVK